MVGSPRDGRRDRPARAGEDLAALDEKVKDAGPGGAAEDVGHLGDERATNGRLELGGQAFESGIERGICDTGGQGPAAAA